MSITLHEIENESENLYGEIRQNKYKTSYEVTICLYGHTLYNNFFSTMENAKRALKRNFKSIERSL